MTSSCRERTAAGQVTPFYYAFGLRCHRAATRPIAPTRSKIHGHPPWRDAAGKSFPKLIAGLHESPFPSSSAMDGRGFSHPPQGRMRLKVKRRKAAARSVRRQLPATLGGGASRSGRGLARTPPHHLRHYATAVYPCLRGRSGGQAVDDRAAWGAEPTGAAPLLGLSANHPVDQRCLTTGIRVTAPQDGA
jgi:hypothetical protein